MVVEEGGGGGRMKEDEWNINHDAVDVAFKLRSHAQSLHSISTCGDPIIKIKID